MNSPLNTLARVVCGIIGSLMAFFGVIMAWSSTSQIAGGFPGLVAAAGAIASICVMRHWAMRSHTTWKPARDCWLVVFGLNMAVGVVTLIALGWPELDTGTALLGAGRSALVVTLGMGFWKLITLPWPRIQGDPTQERQTTGTPGDDAWTPEWLKRNGKDPL